MLILIIDDSEIFRSRLVEILSESPNSKKLLEVNNIFEAKEIMQSLLPDLIITDIRMPGGSGIDLIKELRKKNINITTMVITNYPEEHYKTEAIKAGADYFFDKSNDMEKMLEAIDILYSNKNKYRSV